MLVNSAGFTRIPHHDLEALTDELINSIFAANVRRPFATIRAFAPLMKKAAGAVIVNISSIAAIVGTGSNIPMAARKPLWTPWRCRWRGSWARNPGARRFRQPRWTPRSCRDGRPAMVEKVASTTPLKRVVQADGVAQAVMAAVVNLTSTTGWIIPVDGGKLVG